MQKKSEIFKKHNFSGQVLKFLPPRKPGLYISRVYFFFFEYHELKSICIFVYLGELFCLQVKGTDAIELEKKN